MISLKSFFDNNIFIPSNHQYIKVAKADILYVEADGAYVNVVTKAATYSLSLHLSLFIKQLNDPFFYRISRSHLVNIRHIDKINKTVLHVNNYELPISRAAVQKLLEQLPIIRTKLPKRDSLENIDTSLEELQN